MRTERRPRVRRLLALLLAGAVPAAAWALMPLGSDDFATMHGIQAGDDDVAPSAVPDRFDPWVFSAPLWFTPPSRRSPPRKRLRPHPPRHRPHHCLTPMAALAIIRDQGNDRNTTLPWYVPEHDRLYMLREGDELAENRSNV